MPDDITSPAAPLPEQQTAPAPAPPPEPTFDPTPEPPGLSGVKDYLVSRGLDAAENYGTEEELLGAVFDEASRRQQPDPQMQHLASLGQEFQRQQADPEYQRWAQERAKPVAKDPEHVGPEWEVEEFDPVWEQYVRPDSETGQYVPRTNDQGYYYPGSIEVAEKFNRRRKWERDKLNSVLTEFPSLVERFTEPRLEKLKQEMRGEFEEAYRTLQSQSQTIQYFNANADDLFMKNEHGQVIADPNTGDAALNPKGQLIQYHAGMARNLINKPDEAMTPQDWDNVRNFAVSGAERDWGMVQAQQQAGQQPEEAPPAEPETPRQRNRLKKERFIERSAREAADHPAERPTGSRDVANAASMASQSVDYADLLDEELDRRGITLR